MLINEMQTLHIFLIESLVIIVLGTHHTNAVMIIFEYIGSITKFRLVFEFKVWLF